MVVDDGTIAAEVKKVTGGGVSKVLGLVGTYALSLFPIIGLNLALTEMLAMWEDTARFAAVCSASRYGL